MLVHFTALSIVSAFRTRHIGIFFDFTKTHDILNQDTLLEKLNTIGVRRNINSWFKSHLTDQKQFVERKERDHINFRQDKYLSHYIVLTHRVPKGLALGSQLFLIYKVTFL